MKRNKIKININDIIENSYYTKMYKTESTKYLKSAIKRSNGIPIHEIVVVKSLIDTGKFSLISGGARLKSIIENGFKLIDAILIEDATDQEIKNLVIDLNKYRKKSGLEIKNELIHFNSMYPPNKGGLVNRYELIGQEMGISSDRIKKILTLYSLFKKTEYEFIIEQVLSNEISLRKSMDIAKWYKNRKTDLDPSVIIEMVKSGTDFEKINSINEKINLNNNSEFNVLKDCLTEKTTESELNNRQKSLIEAKSKIEDHLNDKIWISDVSTDDLKYCKIIQGNSRTVDINCLERYLNKVKMFVGSCEYGYATKRPGREFDDDHERLSKMSSEEFAKYTASIYARYKPFLTDDGSVYVIINDYKVPSASKKFNTYSCFTEHFVLEMLKKGFFLVERKIWVKTNPLPRQHKYKDMVESYEYVYRFAINKDNYYQRSLKIMSEDFDTTYKLVSGCTNHSPNQTEVRGGKYIQSSLKKIRNTLDNDYCKEIIRGNVGNPGDFFRQLFDKHHSSTSPIYLTAVLTLAATEPGDLVMDIWNGVGNSMLSSLLLGRKYIGIEIEQEYYKQTLVKASETEKFVDNHNIIKTPLKAS
jgi:DNA modification methylase